MSDNIESTLNSEQAFQALGSFLTQDNWHPKQIDDKYIYRVAYGGKNGQYACFAQIRTDLEQLIFYVMIPVKAPPEKRAALAEFITRANYGLRIGNFEMDFSDGEVRYKSSLDFAGVELTPRLIENTIYPAVSTCDRYQPGIMQIIYGNISPVEAIAEIESK